MRRRIWVRGGLAPAVGMTCKDGEASGCLVFCFRERQERAQPREGVHLPVLPVLLGPLTAAVCWFSAVRGFWCRPCAVASFTRGEL